MCHPFNLPVTSNDLEKIHHIESSMFILGKKIILCLINRNEYILGISENVRNTSHLKTGAKKKITNWEYPHDYYWLRDPWHVTHPLLFASDILITTMAFFR